MWAAIVGAIWGLRGAGGRAALLLGLGVLSHWALDAIVHRPDLPVLPSGPYVGLGLWNSIPGTLLVELALFAAGLWLYLKAARRVAIGFWILMAFLLVAYLGAAFGPAPPDVTTLAMTALAMWLVAPVAWWAERKSELRM